MPQRDPNKTARNKAIQAMKDELRTLLPSALAEVHNDDEASLNAFIGSKAEHFIDLKHEVIRSPEEYVSKWLQGLTKQLTDAAQGTFVWMHDYLNDASKINFRKYCEIFLRRSFLKHYDELSKIRPREDEANYWFGLNNAQHGIFVTPRFNNSEGNWENDKSEIRAFPETYWSIGHVLKTGLCYQGENRLYSFSDVESYLSFFYNQVRLTQSKYQLDIADRYITYVRASKSPTKIPLLIPELRFNAEKTKHEYRLDFFVINPYTMDKIGFEFSPWSTHGQLTGRNKTLKELNAEALSNFEDEVKKVKAYFKKFNIFTLTYSDSDLKDMDAVFNDIKKYLNPSEPPVQLSLNLIDSYFGIK
jgi:hypothetical protein